MSSWSTIVSSPYRYSNNCALCAGTSSAAKFQVLIGILTMTFVLEIISFLDLFQVLIGILTIVPDLRERLE